jgi:protein-disulfide isomerase
VGSALAAEKTGSAAPEVTIDLFSDFQCPFCAGLAQPMHDLQSKGVDGVRLAVNFKHYPLSSHADAPLAHQAALAARQQGRFWEMHDLLFANQRAVKRTDLLGYAKSLDLDLVRFQKDLDGDAAKTLIESDKAEGDKRGVNGTPTFFVNGKLYVGAKTFDQLKHLVQDEQRRAVALSEITDNLMSKGPATAPVTLEFFADLQSPVSRPAIAVLDEVMRSYPQTVRLQFRNFPLAFHPQAALAHDAAMTAARLGRFWEFTNFILDHQDSLREQDLIAFAGQLGLDAAKFAATIEQRRYTPRVEADLMNGLNRGIRGSPVIFVNGKRIDGVPSLETLTKYVEAEVAAKK